LYSFFWVGYAIVVGDDLYLVISGSCEILERSVGGNPWSFSSGGVQCIILLEADVENLRDCMIEFFKTAKFVIDFKISPTLGVFNWS